MNHGAEKFLDILYPRKCPGCGEILRPQGRLICPDCERRYRSGGVSRQDLKPLSALCLAAMRYAISAPLPRLFAFNLPAENLREMEEAVRPYLASAVDKKLKSLQILEVMAR